MKPREWALLGATIASLLIAASSWVEASRTGRIVERSLARGGTVRGAVTFSDNIESRYGTGIDYWEDYDSAAAQWQLSSTDVDGAGADGVVMSVDDGDDVVDFTDGITTGGVSEFAGDIRLNAAADLVFDSDDDTYIDTNTDDNMRFVTGAGLRMELNNSSLNMAHPIWLHEIAAAAPSEPHACNNSSVGAIVYVDDTNDSAPGEVCLCVDTDDGSTFDWRSIDDVTAACPFF